MLGEVGAESSVVSLGVPAAAIALLDTTRGTGDFPRGMANAVETKGWSDWEQSGATTLIRAVIRQIAAAWAVLPLAATIRTTTPGGRGT